MKIVADENIPYVREAFGSLGEVVTVPGREIGPDSVAEAELVLVRSITEVNAALIEGSRVRFVGTATIGTDHVDEEYLRSRGIAFASAPGSNANSVAEYIVAALLVLARKKGFRLRGTTIGVVGVGNCGSCVVRKAEALGMKVLMNDPPLYRKTGDEKFRPIEELLDGDILTLHVPLTYEGIDATYHLVDEAFLRELRQDCTLINTARGSVVDNRALLSALEARQIGGAVLDVWENEPQIDLNLLDRADIGTSHIAGYSLDGKVNATATLYHAACDFLSVEPKMDVGSFVPKPACPLIEVRHGVQPAAASHRGRPATTGNAGVVTPGQTDEDTVADIVREVYDIERDDAALRRLHDVALREQAGFFDRLRREYPVRREFHNTEVALPGSLSRLAGVLAGLGFRVRKDERRTGCDTWRAGNCRH